MNIVIRATKEQQQELNEKGFGKDITVQWIDRGDRFLDIDADVYFDLTFNDADPVANEFISEKLVFVHAVSCLCSQINKPNYIRINAWNGFLNRPVIELAASSDAYKKPAEEILKKMEWQFVWTGDDYGLVAARVLVMIINEAYYALEEKISTRSQIDVAMKLGTNYHYGPVEWAAKIGLKQILLLLRRLSAQDGRYTISSLLVQESQQC